MKLEKNKLSLYQQEIYYGQLINSKSPAYNIGCYIIFKGKLDIDKLKSIIENLPFVFDIYNFKYNLKEEEPSFYVKDTIEKLIVDEVNFSLEDTPKEKAIEWMRKEFNATFDLPKGKLYKYTIIKIGENESWVMLKVHHLLLDGFGFFLKCNYILKEYGKQKGGINKEILYPSYYDKAIKSLEYLKSEQYIKDREYWKEKYKVIPSSIVGIKKEGKSLEGGRYTIPVPKSDKDFLIRLSNQVKVGIPQLTIAALLIYYGKTTSQTAFSIGVPIHNRSGREERKTLGMFSKILPFKGEYLPNQTLLDFIQIIKQGQHSDFRHKLYPLSHLNRELQLLAKERQQIFDIQVNYEPFLLRGAYLPNLSIEVHHLTGNLGLLTPLSFRWSDYGEGFPMKLHVDYQYKYFNLPEIEIFVERLFFILRQFESSLNNPVKNINILSKSEEEELLYAFNATEQEYPKDKTIVSLFEQQVKEAPDSIAVVFEEEQLTYRELDKRSNQLAHYLIAQGVKPDDIVGICLERSLEMIIGILGVLKSGGAYLPIDPDYPVDRINYMISDSGIKILLSDNTSKRLFLERSDLSIISLEGEWNTIDTYSSNRLASIGSPSNLAYVIYTSGSTGKPKGVMIEHSSLLDYVFGVISKTNIENCKSFGLISTIAADLGNTVIFPSLVLGGKLILFSHNEILSSHLISKKKVDCLKIVPSHWKALQSDDTSFFPNKCLIFGGEKLTKDVVDMVRDNGYTGIIYNHYGPTETTIGNLLREIDYNKPNFQISLGKAIGNSQIYILDSSMSLVPIGVIGELCISGSGLARGYLNRPDLTAEKFVSHPFKSGERIYKTGDLARWLPDGNIEFIGRKDDQVKIRGYRIELGEIENVLSGVPEVIQCCVIAKKGPSGSKRLIAYVVLEGTLDKLSLEESLKRVLPDYMVPQLWIELETIPLTSNGKIDKQALPSPADSDLSNKVYVAPSTTIEKQLVRIWQELLEVEKIGIYDNFFELGGHSLLAVQLISRLQKIGYYIEVKDIFSTPSITSIASKLSLESNVTTVPENGITLSTTHITPSMLPLVELNQEEINSIVGTIPGGISNIQDIYPLSPLQEGIYFQHMMSSSDQGDSYILSNLISFSTPTKRDDFIDALSFIISRHDTLRTCIISKELPLPVQVVLREVSLIPEILDLKDIDNTLEELKSLVAPGGQWLDVSQAPLIQIKIADDQVNNCYYLIINLHHLITDHVGLEKIVSEVFVYLSGDKKSLSTPVLYRDFISHTLQQQLVNDSESHFKSLLGTIKSPTYPFELSNIQINAKNIEEHRRVLPNRLSKTLRDTSTKLGLSPAVFFHAAYGLVVGQCSNSEYTIFGSLFSGRLQGAIGSEDSLGLFINTLPVYLELKGTVSEYLFQVQQCLNDLLPFEQTPLSHIQDWSGIANDMAFFSALLNYRHSSILGGENQEKIFEDLGMSVIAGQERTNYPFAVNVDDYGDDFELTAQIDKGIGANRIVTYMETALENILAALEARKKITTKEISILSKSEEDELLYAFNATEQEYPKDKTIVSLFEQQVKEAPDSIAVVFEEEQLTYRELDKRSNQLAHYLIAQGVKPDDIVGICLERSLEMIIGILGVLKSGGAYLPIDPDYPVDRINYMISDSGIKILLSDNASKRLFLERSDLSIMSLEGEWNTIDTYSSNRLASIGSPSNLAYVIYTSGSTGKPKGVLISHYNVIRIVRSTNYINIIKNDRILQLSNYVFDGSIFDIYGALSNGAILVMINKEDYLNINKLSNCIKDHKISVLFATTAMFNTIVDVKLNCFEKVRKILFGGESISLKHVDKAFKFLGGDKIIHVYGPTESTVYTTYHTINKIDSNSMVIPIGKPITNTNIYILNSSMSLVPIGVIGELCISGSGLARGYLNRPDLTAEKFVSHPFKSGERIYKTGDLARWLPDGNIEFIGRKDDQVKIRGYRIELGEIENVLYGVPEVIQCCVIAKKGPSGSKRLIAYVVLEGTLDKLSLEESLKRVLPDYMVPQLWIELETIPLTSNGKIDKQALPSPADSDLSNKVYVAPSTTIEKQLVRIWQELLEVEKIGIYDNFFELGGHSLLAVQLISRLQKIGYYIEVKDIFSTPSITSIASKLSLESNVTTVPENGITLSTTHITPSMLPLVELNQEEINSIVGTIPGGISNIQDIYPLSPLQEGIYFQHMMSSSDQGDSYILSNLISFSTPTKRDDFIDALSFIISRHDTLRTCIISKELPLPVQVVLREVSLIPEILDLKDIDNTLEELKSLVAPGGQWLDVSQAPLIQIKIADDQVNNCYYLIINLHHLITDHVGLEKIVSEVFIYLSGDKKSLSTPVLYRDFISHTLQQQLVNDSESHFKSLLGTIKSPTYPFELSNIQINAKNIEEHRRVLPNRLSKTLRDTSTKLGLSPAVFFHAAYGLVVGQCSNSEYTIFGSLFSGRLQGAIGSEDSLGLFINTLPVYLELKGTVSEYLFQVQQCLNDLLPFEQTPLSHIQDWSGIANDMAFFSALLNYRHSSILGGENQEKIFEDLGMSVIAGQERTNYPFAVNVDDYGDDFELTAQIDEGIGANRIVTYMETALENILAALEARKKITTKEISILSKSEEDELLYAFNATEQEYPKDKTIVSLFEQQVKEAPDSIAVVFEEEQLTYRELDKRSNQLAHYLIAQGVKPDDIVGICLERSLEMIIGILGVLKSGGAYLPIDPDYPVDRINYMISDSGIKILLSDNASKRLFLERSDLSIMSLEGEWNTIDTYSSNRLASIGSPSNLAYVIYTSGSTGKPKGVMIEHKGIFNTIISQVSIFSMTKDDHCLLFASPSFDASVWEVFLSLCSGSSLHILTESIKLDIVLFKDFIVKSKISFATLPPTFLQLLSIEDLEGVRKLVTAGEAIPLSIAKTFSEKYSYINAYGPTEASICATLFQDKISDVIPIGRPIANTNIYILDSSMSLVPIGVIGELCISGSGLARGYLNRPDLTAEKFVSHPFKSGERIYKTGDLARWLPDGNIEFIGRKDDQVKIRGYRIELGEIENVLSGVPEVIQCCVIAKKGPSGSKRLIAYVVLEGTLDKLSLEESLKRVLPDYMVPQLWIELETIPLTSNGKIDKQALPSPADSDLSNKVYVAPSTTIEKQLVRIWQELLEVEKIGIYDNFFELGGHSLLAVQLISRLQKIGYYIEVKDIFSNPSITSIASKLSLESNVTTVPENGITLSTTHITPSMLPLVELNQEEINSIVGTIPGGISNIQDIYPLSPLQEGIYFQHMMSSSDQGDSYILSNLISFSTPTKRDDFIDALSFIISRHDTLRTCIISKELPLPVQVVLREVSLIPEILDLKDTDNTLEELKPLVVPGSQWFDVSQAPLIQIKIADDQVNNCYYLIINLHHLITDHVGLEKIVSEVFIYLSGDKKSLSTPVLYRNFISHTLQQQLVNDSESHFKSLLGTIKSPTYPFELSNIQINAKNIEEHRRVLPNRLSKTLRDTSTKLGLSPAVFFHAAYGLVVGQCSNSEYTIFGSLFSGRLQGAIGSEDSLGLFINTLPVYLELKGTVSEYLFQVQQCLNDLLPFEQTPLSHIQDWSGIANDIAFFSALLNYRYSSVKDQEITPEDLGMSVIAGQERTNYPFAVNVDDYGDDFELTAQIDKGIGANRIVTYMETALENILAALEARKKITTKEISVLSKSEEDELLYAFNATEQEYPKDKTIVSLFEQQVKEAPDSIAVVFEEEQLTYRELDKRSNQLAHYLIAQGVKPDDIVGICLERSLEMIIGILGVLKSGGAYLPIDPDYPVDRINYMISDSGIKILLSDNTSKRLFLERSDLSIMSLEGEWNTIDTYSSNRLASIGSPSNLAYVIYTSGSTGKPKGVMIEHRSIANRLLWGQSHYQLTSKDAILQKTSFSFDVSIWELFWPILAGSKLVFAKPEGHKDPYYLKQVIERESITTIHFVPSMLSLFLDEITLGDCLSLRHVLCSGEALQKDQAMLFKEKFTGVQLDNLYGPTEASIEVSLWEVPERLDFSTIAIGKPIANTKLYILDSSMSLVPIGVIGELCISGSGLARGYLNRPDLTAEKFVSHPFKSGERIYKTGDLARWLPDGNIEFIGRKDDQVKIRGYRIELGEIENVLSGVPEVIQCCVIAKKGPSGSKRLIAYVVLEGTLDKLSLEESLKRVLPDYMVPQLWIELETIPLTSNGKIDKQALPSPADSDLSNKVYVAPSTTIEKQLVRIWQELLEVEKIGIHDNFFELGGHSLLATRLVSAIRRDLELEVPIREIFEYSTIASLSSRLELDLTGNLLPPITVEEKPSNIPLSFSQERLWFLDQLQGSLEYHIPYVIHLEGSLDINSLEESLKTLIFRHQVLRTNIYSIDGVGYQKVIPADSWELDRNQISDATILETELKEYILRPFDLSSDYKLRACLYSLDNNQYVVSFVFHHIASDGWSSGILVKEITSLYNSLVLSEKIVLPELDLQYSDYALWEDKHLRGSILESQLSYWEQQLEGVVPLNLPFDYPRPAVQSIKGANLSFTLDKELTDSLNSLSRKENVSLFMLLLSAFKVLMYRYTGERDICIGSPIANRRQANLENIIGFFVNTLALRTNLLDSQSFKEVLSNVKETTLDAYEHQSAPFEKVVDRVSSTRDRSKSPLFQIMFALENTQEVSPDINLVNTVLSKYEYENTTAKFDLTFNLTENITGITLNINYCSDLFKASRIETMFFHYQRLLKSIVADVEQKIDTINILSKSEEEELLYAFNATEQEYPKDKTIVSLFEQQVKEAPDSIAVVFEEEQLTYRELDKRSNQLAHYLIAQGVKPDDIVGICLERSLEMIIGILGVLKSGGAYLPIDPDYPVDRINYMISDSGIKILLSDNTSKRLFLERSDLSIMSLEGEWNTIDTYSSNRLASIGSPSNLAYVIYTSGSTGKPKGVMIEHRSIANRLLWGQSHYQLTSKDAILQKTSFSFDVSIWELFWPILAGSKLVFAKPEGHKDPYYLKQVIERESITTIHFVPSMLSLFLDEITLGDCLSLRHVLCSGEALQKDQAMLFKEKFTGVQLDNLYGPTEASIEVSLWEVPERLDFSTIAIGKPIANTKLYILDSSMSLVPIGVIGELCISGSGLARGYLNRPDLTAEKFVSHPFKSGERIYKTGDLARWLPDGNIEFIGRKDDQVKIRGYRIELGEIENVLYGVPEVIQCCVIAKKGPSGSKRLIAYVVLEGTLDKLSLEESLKRVLPDYMVPQLWIELETIPLTSNGKIDKQALPSPADSDLSNKVYVAPSTTIEKQLVRIWQELLEVEKIGIYDNFFELGGHSLLATRLVSAIRRDLELEVPIREIFEYSTIASLSSRLELDLTGNLLPPITVEEKPSNIPLSFSQERLWFLDQLQGSLEYHIPYVIHLEGSLDINSLEESLKTLIFRHQVLRTNIYSIDGVGYQKVIPADSWELDRNQISDATILETELKEYILRPFDLSSDYKLRACLYSLDNNQYVVSFVFHHIASDGWSSGILVKEITSLYNSLVLSEKIVLPELDLQYSDYALWEDKHLRGSILESQLSYWEQQLEGVVPLNLPFDYPRPAVQSIKGANLSFTLDKELTDSLNSLSRKENVSLFMLLLSAFKVLMYRYTGERDICIGSPIANRRQANLENIIGFFVNTLALRTNLLDSQSFKEVLSNVKETTLDAYEHQSAPFEKVVDRVSSTRDRSKSPLFQIMFALENTQEVSPDINLVNTVLSKYEYENTTAKFDLTFNLTENITGITLNINYCSDLFKASRIETMFFHYQRLLKSIVADVEQKIDTINILSKSEEEELLYAFNATEQEYPKDKTIVSLFEQQVKEAPDSIAVVFEEEQLTYRELDKRSNQLAHYLIAQGVKPDDIVGICLERSLEMIIGILGVLKSGGAYLPIDPDYPVDRINYMISDSGIKILLSDNTSKRLFLERSDLSIMSLEGEWNTIDTYSSNRLASIGSPSNLAYVIYTSGSTGKPKGVMIEHRSIANRLLWGQSHYQLTSKDAILQKTSFSFDVSIWELFWPILAGSKLVFAKPEGHKDPYYLKQVIERESITTIHFVPSMLSLFLDEITLGDCLSLRHVLCSGEALQKDQAMLFKEKFTGVQLDNLYGPTEASIEVSLWEVPERLDFSTIAIGKPIANTKLYILDSSMSLVPIGVIGELCISGSGLARGYLDRPDLTAEKFVSHPFKSGERIYKTGDLARWLPDGNIEFIGRKDDQVKIRGYRIELGEIENVLSGVPEVIQCCVIAKKGPSGSKRLIAYVVLEGTLDKLSLEESLKRVLPDYMVPQLWIELETIPLTSNGKIDKQALPSPADSDLSNKVYVAPSTTIEKQLVRIWQELLEVEKIGIYDNFFELGGHSLLAVQLISRLQKIGYYIEVKDIFSTPSITSIASKLSLESNVTTVPENGITLSTTHITPSMLPLVELNQEEINSIVGTIPGGISNIQDIYPLSPLQEGIYFQHMMSSSDQGDSYILSNLISFSTPTKRDDFIDALSFIISRHDTLRTCIISKELPLPVQVVLREVSLIPEILDLKDIDNTLEELKSLVAPGGQWLDVSQAPLIQIKIADDQVNNCYYLIINLHHLITDHVGLEKIVSEVFVYLSGDKKSLSTPVLYRDFISHTLQQQLVNDSESHFKSLLGTIKSPTYPFELSNIQINAKNIEEHRRVLPNRLSKTLRDTSTKLGLSPAVFFHAAYGLVVGQCSNSEYTIFGSLFSGRLQGAIGSEDFLGLFINTLPVYLELKGTVSEYLFQVQQCLNDLLPFEQTPLSHIQDWSGIANDMAFFSALLNYRHSSILGGENQEKIFEDLGMSVIAGQERTNYPFAVNVDDYGDDFELTAQIDKGIGANRIVTYMETALENILAALEARKKITTKEISVLSKSEEEELLYAFNATEQEYPKDKTIVSLFEQQVKEAPDSIAVVFEEEQLTYRELDKRSNQLAHYLIAQGVKPDDIVGICLERSLEMIIGILGVLKSGGAYLPIDPDYPVDRINYMISDSGIKILLSDNASKRLFLERSDLSIMSLEGEWNTIDTYSSNRLASIGSPSNLAYVIYTSGSTGKPKGVMIEHKGIFNTIISQVSIFSMTKDDHCLLFASPSFDASVWEVFLSLCSGSSLHILTESIKLDIALFKDFIIKSKISFAILPPTFLQLLSIEDLEGVRKLVTGGEAIPLNIAKTFSEKYSYINAYGPTEASICATLFQDKVSDIIPIGRPIANTNIYILDSSMSLVPIGVIGELCISGSGLARGYLNRPDLTAEKFVSHPFKSGERIYKTGDLARWLPDGNIEFIGRKDDQVKIRGYRIELGEIENVLYGVPEVIQCCVIAKKGPSGSKRLIAYVVLEGTLDKLSLEESLKRVLPDYMVPQLWIELETIPLTSNGKIDKQALPSPADSDLSNKVYVAPSTTIEKQLVRIWQELLEVEKIGIHDNFFELGGHSLLAVRLVNKLNEVFKRECKIDVVFKYPTVSEIIDYMKSGNEMNLSSGVIKITQNVKESNKRMFCVPGAGGHITSFYQLSSLLEESHILYGFQAYGLDKEDEAINTIEALAAQNIKDMQEIDSQGPYCLVGYSLGATVAYEMSLQLIEKGYEISELIIIDGLHSYSSDQASSQTNSYLEHLISVFNVICNYYDKVIQSDIIEEALIGKSKKEQIDLIYNELTMLGIGFLTKKSFKLFVSVYIGQIEMSLEYKSKIIEGYNIPIYLFKSRSLNDKDVPLEKNGEDFGWGLVTEGKVIIEEVDGTHLTMLNLPFVKEIAKKIVSIESYSHSIN